MDLDQIRSQFPITTRYTYLNHSSIGPLSIPVQQAIAEAVSYQADGSEGNDLMKARIPGLKERIAKLINASTDEIALVRNTVEGLSTVASGILWNEGDNVVTDDIEFPANMYPWLNQESRYGVKTKQVPARDGKVLAEDLIAACDEHTRIISVSFVQFSNGYRADMERIGAFCRERDILFCVDAIQGLGALQMDVRKYNIDFLAAGSHKWLMGPVGIGFLYLRKDRQADLWPAEVGHLGVLQNTDKYTEYNLTFRDSAEKFEGGVPNYTGVFGFDESLKLFHGVGPAAIEERVLMLTDHLCEGIEERGYRLLSHRAPMEKSGTVTFVSDQVPSTTIFDTLSAAGVIVSLREGAIRVAPHFYNTTDEVDRLLETLPKL
jgi:cysteine desulfurase / selenocysteine lyase